MHWGSCFCMGYAGWLCEQGAVWKRLSARWTPIVAINTMRRGGVSLQDNKLVGGGGNIAQTFVSGGRHCMTLFPCTQQDSLAGPTSKPCCCISAVK